MDWLVIWRGHEILMSEANLKFETMKNAELILLLEQIGTHHADNGDVEYGRPFVEAANKLQKMQDALRPFAEAAEKADESSDQQKRLLGVEMSEDSSPGWGIKRIDVNRARDVTEGKQ